MRCMSRVNRDSVPRLFKRGGLETMVNYVVDY